MEDIENRRNDLLKVLMSAYEQKHDRHAVLLLACSVTPVFTRKFLWEELIKPLGIFHGKTEKANKKNMDTYFDAFLKYKPKKFNGAVSIVKSEKTTKFYTLNADGFMMISEMGYGEYLNLVQLLMDNSSEEVEGQLCVLEAKPRKDQDVFQAKIETMCDDLKMFLMKKNSQYGSSTLDPLNIFKQLSRSAKVESRIEDKIARLKNIDRDSEMDAFIDTIRDLAGYLILYLIILEEEKNEP
jgi:hypothetical protein